MSNNANCLSERVISLQANCNKQVKSALLIDGVRLRGEMGITQPSININRCPLYKWTATLDSCKPETLILQQTDSYCSLIQSTAGQIHDQNQKECNLEIR